MAFYLAWRLDPDGGIPLSRRQDGDGVQELVYSRQEVLPLLGLVGDVVEDDSDEQEKDARDIEHYIEKMREDGEWGGDFEVTAAARLYR